MRIRMLATRVLDKPKGMKETYHGHPEFPSHYTVPDDLAKRWIAEGAAEDYAGKVRRIDLLSYEEAVAARLCPSDLPPGHYEYFQKFGAPPPPAPVAEPTTKPTTKPTKPAVVKEK